MLQDASAALTEIITCAEFERGSAAQPTASPGPGLLQREEKAG
jgi:hypothetical protein